MDQAKIHRWLFSLALLLGACTEQAGLPEKTSEAAAPGARVPAQPQQSTTEGTPSATGENAGEVVPDTLLGWRLMRSP